MKKQGLYCIIALNGGFMRKKKVCEQRAVLELMKSLPKNGGLSKAAKALHDAQCRDFEKMEKRMTDIEKKVDVIDKKIETVESKIDRLTDIVEKRSSFTQNIKEIFNNKVFLYLLISLICATCGVSIGEVGTFLFQ